MPKLKGAYLVWFEQYKKIPKLHRHTLGARVDAILIECIEMINAAAFLPRPEKLPYIKIAMRKVDTLKVLLLVLWEIKSLDNKKYITVSLHIEEISKMLGGWHGQLMKQNGFVA